MTFVVYEHPLNEKVRLLMRLELLFSQLQSYKHVSTPADCQTLFKYLLDCVELLERNDIRPTLSFYLDVIERNMIRWSSHPDIHDQSLQQKLREVVKTQVDVTNMNKACQELKEDKFLVSLRQRFAIAGGACDFDLPQLHFWLTKPIEQKNEDVDLWLSVFKPIENALELCMLFLRESNKFVDKIAEHGVYQDSCDDSVSLLRVKYPSDLGCFPTVSGSKHRYSISFMEPDKVAVKRSTNDTIPFQLATC